jgi:hypothetical protein
MTQQDLIAVRGSKISLIDPDGIDDLSVNGRLGER